MADLISRTEVAIRRNSNWEAILLEEIFQPQDHERAITAHFGDAAHYIGEKAFDEPLYLIGFSNRSGSNLLAEYLASTGKFSLLEENLNAATVIEGAVSNDIPSFPHYVYGLAKEMIDNGKFPGFKANWTQIVMLHRLGITRLFPSVRVISTQRTDLLGQAISFSIAAQTGQWTSGQQVATKAEYNFEDISGRMFGTNYANMATGIITQALGMQSINVFYEELEVDPAAVIAKIGQCFQIDFGDWTPPVTELRKQRTTANDAMRATYLADVQKRMTL
jgi:LPS sulfotransferase NodH